MLTWVNHVLESNTFFQLADVGIKSIVLLALATGAVWCARKVSASTRAIIWQSAIFSLFLLPFLPLVGPKDPVSLGINPNQSQAPSVSIIEPSVTPPTEVATGPQPALVRLQQPIPQAQPAQDTEAAQPFYSSIQVPIHQIFLAVWLLGAALVSLWLLRGHLFVRRLLLNSQSIHSPRLSDIARRVGSQYGLRTDIPLANSENLPIPLVCGLSKPTVLLPKEWHTWSDERLELVLLHEFAHIVRHDVPMRALAHMLLPFYWFNPLLWFAIQRLSWEQERACDDLVLGSGAKPSQYAKTLLIFAQSNRGPLLMSATQLTGTTIKNRILSVLASNLKRHPIRRKVAMSITATAMLTLVPFAVSTVFVLEKHKPTSIRKLDQFSAGTRVEGWNRRDPDQLTRQDIDQIILELSSGRLHDIRNGLARLKVAGILGHPPDLSVKPYLMTILKEHSPLDIRQFPKQKWLHSSEHFNNLGREAASVLAQMDEETLTQLLDMLDHSNPMIRANIYFALRQTNDRKHLALLRDALRDPAPIVRQQAADALGWLTDPSSIKPLVSVLNDPDEKVRAQAARSLANIRAPKPASQLVKCLDDPILDVRIAAATALADSRDLETLKALFEHLKDPDVNLRSQVIDSIGSVANLYLEPIPSSSNPTIPSHFINQLIHALDDQELNIRVKTAKALGRFNSELAIPRLIQAVEEDKTPVRIEALDSLGWLYSQKVLPTLINALDDNNPEVRIAAVSALHRQQNPAVEQPLLKALKDSNTRVREIAVRGLKHFKKKSITDTLLDRLNDPQPNVRINAIHALSEHQSQAVFGSLKKAAEDPDSRIRSSVMSALWKQDAITVEPILIKASKDEAPEVRASALRSLSYLKTKNSFSSFVTALKDPQPEVRVEAALGLRRLGDPQAVEPLLAALEDQNPEVISYAALALSPYPSKEVASRLISVMNHTNPIIRANAAISLGYIGYKSVITPLILALDDPQAEVRKQAARALGRIGDTRAISSLRTSISDHDRFVRMSSFIALLNIDKPNRETILEKAGKDDFDYIRMFADLPPDALERLIKNP